MWSVFKYFFLLKVITNSIYIYNSKFIFKPINFKCNKIFNVKIYIWISFQSYQNQLKAGKVTI